MFGRSAFCKPCGERYSRVWLQSCKMSVFAQSAHGSCIGTDEFYQLLFWVVSAWSSGVLMACYALSPNSSISIWKWFFCKFNKFSITIELTPIFLYSKSKGNATFSFLSFQSLLLFTDLLWEEWQPCKWHRMPRWPDNYTILVASLGNMPVRFLAYILFFSFLPSHIFCGGSGITNILRLVSWPDS